ncbi:hypothetical protein PISMIDRAFT_8544 [Pisolithus microcarpus 441]|uniref:Uncharacterized protein n=1 Tax=Pisolithus microcarpus 441 TaxID=765257 RepID=A0A0C9YPQ7_9AGAM|nr:hypothetical protein PISMIDRAFT_8544 [Pisolithus microcarpus 441]
MWLTVSQLSHITTASSTSPHSQIARSPYALPSIVSGARSTLYRTLGDIIGLGDCQVFSYTPDPDPHANDYSDDKDDVTSVADEYSSDDLDLNEGDATFEFDADDQDFVTSSDQIDGQV